MEQGILFHCGFKQKRPVQTGDELGNYKKGDGLKLKLR